MTSPNASRTTTHDWAAEVDVVHLDRIRAAAGSFAPGGVSHLVLEVLAYAEEEAQSIGAGGAVVTRHADGSISVADNGRGTQMRVDDRGRPIRKPVMATKDLRFFDADPPVLLRDGLPRRGMSVVAALSEWLVHTNERQDGSWTQRYERGLPVTGLVAIAPSGRTGTTVRFLAGGGAVLADETVAQTLSTFGDLFAVELVDER